MQIRDESGVVICAIYDTVRDQVISWLLHGAASNDVWLGQTLWDGRESNPDALASDRF